MKDYVANPGEVSSVDIIRILSQRKQVIFLSVLLTLAIALGISLLMKPTYRATTKVLLREEKLAPSNILPAYSTGEEFLKSQAQIIKSKPIISNALKNTALANPDLGQENDQALDVGSIQEGVSTDFISRTNILELNVEHNSPSFAASLANAIVQSYTDYRNTTKAKMINDSLRAVGRQVETVKGELGQAQQALEKYTRKEQIAVLPESEIVVDLKRFAGFDTQIITLNSDIQKVDTKLQDLREQVYNNHLEDLNLPFLIENATIKEFQADIRDTETKLSDLLTEYTVDHPEVISVLNEIERLKSDLADERRKVVATEIGSYELEKKLLEEKRNVLFKAVASYGARLNKVLFSQPKLSQLLHNVRDKRAAYRGLLNRQQDLKIFKQKGRETLDIQVVETARVPSRPIKPNLLLNSLLGLIVGLSIGCGVALAAPLSIAEKKKIAKVGEERREMLRTDITAEVIYNILGEPEAKHKCRSNDISGSGIRLIIDEKLAKGVILEMEINIPELEPIFTRGEVVWVGEISLREDDKGPFAAGVRFIDIEPADQKRLLEYLYKDITALRKRNEEERKIEAKDIEDIIKKEGKDE